MSDEITKNSLSQEAPAEGALAGDGISYEQRSLLLADMAQILAHEVRNPLGSMELYCSLLRRDLSSQPELQSLVENISEGIRRVNRVITNCLELSKQLTPSRELVPSLSLFLQPMLDGFEVQAEQDGISFSVSIEHQEAIITDASLVEQIATNLIANALDAVREERSNRAQDLTWRAEVGVRLRELLVGDSDKRERVIEIEVSDTGGGISPDDRERICEPFFTTKTTGTGLGLPISIACARSLGGSITFHQKPGGGTSVTFAFPVGSGGEAINQEYPRGTRDYSDTVSVSAREHRPDGY